MYIGNSLSLCIRDMIEYKISPDKVFLITSRNIKDEKDFKSAVQDSLFYWDSNVDLGKEIANKLFKEGKIYSPLANGNSAPDITEHHWFDEYGNKLEFEIHKKPSDLKKFSLK
jgi:hypothetical protein